MGGKYEDLFDADELPVIKRFIVDGDTGIVNAKAVVGYALEL